MVTPLRCVTLQQGRAQIAEVPGAELFALAQAYWACAGQPLICAPLASLTPQPRSGMDVMSALALPDPDAPPQQPQLAANLQQVQGVSSATYWQQLNGHLHVAEGAPTSGLTQAMLPQERLADLRQQIDHAGIAQAGGLQHSSDATVPA
jgi:poly(3-hydroxybutyrate) depolymerase